MSKPERMSFLAAHLTVGRHGAQSLQPLQLREIIRDAVEVTARRGTEAALRKAAKGKLEFDLPAIGAWRESGGLCAIGTAPGGWTWLGKPAEPGAMSRGLRAALGDAASVVDIGHGLACLTLSGASVRHVLSKGCRLDLHPRVFGPGQAARTVIAQIPAMLWMIDAEPTFGVAVPVTFAQSFAHFLLAASAETGCEILPATED